MNWIEKLITGPLDQKKQWRQYKRRKEELPSSHRTALDGVERYLLYAGGISKGEVLMAMLEDLIDLFEQSAASGTPVREVVGEDPVEFAEAFLANYSEGQWMAKERDRLTEAIERAAEDDGNAR